ncbi:Bacterial SH3 domain protein, partial [gut metagenome]
MKKSRLLIALAGLTLIASGCGYSTGGEDSTVTVIKATPTPTATPTPIATPTPAVTATPVPETSQTASGVKIIKKDAVYYANNEANIRTDCVTTDQ